MAVSPIKKLRLIALQKHQNKILKLLHNLGTTEILVSPKELDSSDLASLEYDFAQTKFAVKFLKANSTIKENLVDKLTDKKIEITPKQLKKVVKTFSYKRIVNTLSDFEASLNQDQNDIKKFEEEKQVLLPWQNLKIAPDKLDSSETVSSRIGTLTEENYQKLLDEIKKLSEKTDLLKINTEGPAIYLQIIFQKDIAQKINEVLSKVNWSEESLPCENLAPEKGIAHLDDQITKQQDSIKEIEKEIKSYSKYLRKLQIVSDYLSWQLEEQLAKQKSQYTKETFSLNFWIEKNNVANLEKQLSKITKNYSIEELPIKDKSKSPVVLKNNKFFTSFEAVTDIYGAPKPNEPDPTPFLTPFFIIFFGLALSEAGYGLVLMLGTYLIMKILKIPREDSKLLRVLFYCGISTFIFGALFGSWFGIDFSGLPPAIANVLQKVEVIDVGQNPIPILIMTMILGFIQILTGLVINIWWLTKHGKAKDAILDSGTWIFFLLAIVFYAITKMNIFSEAVNSFGPYVVWAGVIGLVLTQGRDAKNVFVKFFKGVYSLYDLIGYFSDVLSYSRLLALGLATGIIAMVINLVAILFKDMIPYIGWLVAILILVGGHTFNLAINVLGAYIHSGRLQFVEFFPKFMQGGGRKFKPFAKEAYFVKVVNSK